jgi:hypothetical protein
MGGALRSIVLVPLRNGRNRKQFLVPDGAVVLGPTRFRVAVECGNALYHRITAAVIALKI